MYVILCALGIGGKLNSNRNTDYKICAVDNCKRLVFYIPNYSPSRGRDELCSVCWVRCRTISEVRRFGSQCIRGIESGKDGGADAIDKFIMHLLHLGEGIEGEIFSSQEKYDEQYAGVVHPLHVLYRFFDAADSLLYVGITRDPGYRLRTHEGEKSWWHQVASVTIEHRESREDLRDAELAAIRLENPKYNIAGKPEVAGVTA